MQDHIYKVVELVGTSESSIEDAIHGKVRQYQVTLKVGFTMEGGS